MSVSITLWLVPPDHDAERLSKCMASLRTGPAASCQASSPNSFPTFTPHITLLAMHIHPDTLPSALSDLRAAISSSYSSLPPVVDDDDVHGPIAITFASIETGSHFFRSVYVAVHETDALRNLHTAVHAVMQVEPRTPKFPHLSLCYIDDVDAPLREAVTKTALADGLFIPSESGVRLRYGPQDGEWIQEFDCHEVWIMQCGHDLQAWKVLDKVRFTS